jgi:tetratricopeptide (TPR) repeat protein
LLLRAELDLREPVEFEAAKAYLEQARELGADEGTVQVGLARAFNAEGVVRSRRGEHHRALFALKRAADLDPHWSGPLVNRGSIFDRLGQPAKAQALYRRALQLEPRNPVALYNLADSLRRHGGYGESERLYRRLIDLQPGYPGAEAGLRLLLERRFSDGEQPR